MWNGNLNKMAAVSEPPGNDPQRSVPPNSHKKFELSEEEKQVLIECRRNSLMRGLPLGLLSWYAMKTYTSRASAPRFHRWGWLYGSAAFILGTFIGVSSYKEQCYKKIMSLENSRLKDQVLMAKGEIEKAMSQRDGCRAEADKYPNEAPPRTSRYSPRPLHKSESDEVRPQVEESTDQFQPSAFQDTPPGASSWYGEEQVNKPGPTGRTFEEIRAENRKRQLKPVSERRKDEDRPVGEDHWRQDEVQMTGTDSSNKRVRRNKYGDIIIDE